MRCTGTGFSARSSARSRQALRLDKTTHHRRVTRSRAQPHAASIVLCMAFKTCKAGDDGPLRQPALCEAPTYQPLQVVGAVPENTSRVSLTLQLTPASVYQSRPACPSICLAMLLLQSNGPVLKRASAQQLTSVHEKASDGSKTAAHGVASSASCMLQQSRPLRHSVIGHVAG